MNLKEEILSRVREIQNKNLPNPSDMQANIAANIRLAQQKLTQGAVPSFPGSGNNDISFVTVDVPNLPSPLICTSDLQVKVANPSRCFMLVSMSESSKGNAVYFHLNQLNKNYPSGVGTITPDGTEHWLSMIAGGKVVALKFCKPVNEFFLDFDFESGRPFSFTIICFGDDFDIKPDFLIDNTVPSVTAIISGPVTVNGSVAVTNFPATQPVSGSVSVSNFPATQPVSGTVSVSNFPATQNVDDITVGVSINATSQVSVGNTDTVIIAANASRSAILITNLGSQTVFIGESGLTTSTGHALFAGASITLPTVSSIHGIVASGIANVSYLELV